MEGMTYKELLMGLVTGAITTPLLYWLYPRLNIATTDAKRFWTILIAFLLGVVGEMGLLYAGYVGWPVDFESWVNLLIPVGAMAYTASQVVFGLYESRKV